MFVFYFNRSAQSSKSKYDYYNSISPFYLSSSTFTSTEVISYFDIYNGWLLSDYDYLIDYCPNNAKKCKVCRNTTCTTFTKYTSYYYIKFCLAKNSSNKGQCNVCYEKACDLEIIYTRSNSNNYFYTIIPNRYKILIKKIIFFLIYKKIIYTIIYYSY